MSEQDNRKNQKKSGGDDELLQMLLHEAGARHKAAPDFERAARKTLHAEWMQVTGQRRRRRLVSGFAIAASVLMAFAFIMFAGGLPWLNETGNQLARVESQFGTVLAILDDGTPSSGRLARDRWLLSGQWVETGKNSAVALRWMNGQSLRLDENTVLHLETASVVRLGEGRVFVDTQNGGPGREALVIATPVGRVRHVGTRFMTEVSSTGTTISVRAGTVALEMAGSQQQLVAQGEQMIVTGDGKLSTRQIDTWGEAWRWAERVTPAFDSDGKSIADLMDWIGYETGHGIRYASVEAESQARNTILRGKLELEPMKALTIISETSGMEARVESGLITLSLAPAN